MPITLNGTTGVVTPGATVGSITGVLKATSGVVAQAVAGSDYGQLTLATAQTASGTAVDFTGIPSWVKRITVMLNGISTSGTSPLLLRVGTSSGIIATGYNASAFLNTSAGNFNISNIAFPLTSSGLMDSSGLYYGTIILNSLSSTIWSQTGSIYPLILGQASLWLAGNVSFSGTLDRVRITTTNGTDTFDAGTINISYE